MTNTGVCKTAVLVLWLTMLSACSETPPRQFASDDVPPLLSQWQLLNVDSRSQTLTLDPAVQAYDLATPLFSDYALKLRTVWLPAGTQARPTATGSVDFPVGTVISKTFYYPRVPDTAPDQVAWTQDLQFGFDGQALDLSRVHLIETRLLVHQSDGWQALPYVWNAEQTDARLQIAGDLQRLTLHRDGTQQPFAYVVPNRNECAACHRLDQNTEAISPIGPSIRNLNRLISFDNDGEHNQLEIWQARGLLSALPLSEQRAAAAMWQPDRPLTPEHDLDQRARTYLDVNCAHCHQVGGSGDTSGLFLNADEASATRLGVCKPPVAAGRGTGGHRFSIVPGAPEQSILHWRIESTEVGVLMPEIGRSLIHEEGLALVGAWIAQLPGDCN